MEAYKKTRIAPKMQMYRAGNTFVDVILRFNGKDYPAHRLVLAKFSKWFENAFLTTTMPDATAKEHHPTLIFDLPENPNDAIIDVLNFIYFGKIQITVENIPPLLKMAVFYGIDILGKVVRNCLREATQPSTVLKFCNEFISLGLIDDAILLAPFIAKEMALLYKEPGFPHALHIDEIFSKVTDGRVFAAILKSEELSEPTPERLMRFRDEQRRIKATQFGLQHKAKVEEYPFYLKEDEKVAIIDEYVGDREITNELEKEALGSVIDWRKEGSYQYIVHHRCDWLPAHISRRLIIEILRNRRSITDAFEKKSKKASEKICRWYPFSWIQTVRDSKTISSSPVVNVISFISTLGGSANQFNPEDFGLIKTSYTGKLLHSFNAPRVILEDNDDYFAAFNDEGGLPSVTVDLINAHVSAKTFDCDVDIRQIPEEQCRPINIGASYPTKKPAPRELLIRTTEAGKNTNEVVKVTNRVIPKESRKIDRTLGSITIYIKDVMPINILRIKKVEITGSFLPQ